MKIAYIIFDGITWLDLIGIYDPISRLKSLDYLPELSWDICAYSKNVSDNFGLKMKPTKIRSSLTLYDTIIIPGGPGAKKVQLDKDFIGWIKTANTSAYKVSVCTGSLILGTAGFLSGKNATTNFKQYESLKPFCKEVRTERIVEDGNVITAGAVTSSLDLGLYLCAKWSGADTANEIRRQMDYLG